VPAAGLVIAVFVVCVCDFHFCVGGRHGRGMRVTICHQAMVLRMPYDDSFCCCWAPLGVVSGVIVGCDCCRVCLHCCEQAFAFLGSKGWFLSLKSFSL
jgi:hypothetical protein